MPEWPRPDTGFTITSVAFSYDEDDISTDKNVGPSGQDGVDSSNLIDRAFQRYQTQKDAMQRLETR